MLCTALILGLHLVSMHVPAADYQHNFNPGVYVNCDGWTAGVYRNTISRTSVYGGYTFRPFEHVNLMLGFVNGYKLRREPSDCASAGFDPNVYTDCEKRSGSTPHEWTPMVAASVALPQAFGVTPRITYIPKMPSQRPPKANLIVREANSSHTFHLSLERGF